MTAIHYSSSITVDVHMHPRQQVYPTEGGPPTTAFSTLHPSDKPSPLSSLTFTGKSTQYSFTLCATRRPLQGTGTTAVGQLAKWPMS